MYSQKMTERIFEVAEGVLAGFTIRQIAELLGTSKTTVWLDTKRLKKLDYKLWESVNEKLQENFKTKHYRGGMAIKRKFEETKNKS